MVEGCWRWRCQAGEGGIAKEEISGWRRTCNQNRIKHGGKHKMETGDSERRKRRYLFLERPKPHPARSTKPWLRNKKV